MGRVCKKTPNHALMGLTARTVMRQIPIPRRRVRLLRFARCRVPSRSLHLPPTLFVSRRARERQYRRSHVFRNPSAGGRGSLAWSDEIDAAASTAVRLRLGFSGGVGSFRSLVFVFVRLSGRQHRSVGIVRNGSADHIFYLHSKWRTLSPRSVSWVPAGNCRTALFDSAQCRRSQIFRAGYDGRSWRLLAPV